MHGREGLGGERQVRGQVGENGAGDALHVLCARDEDRAMILKGGRITIPGFGSEKVVYGQRVDLAAVGAAVFDFGDSHGLVAAVSEPNAFYILVRYEEQSIRKALCNLHMADPRSRSNLVQYRACATHSP